MDRIRRKRTAERVLVFNASPIIYLCKSGLAGKLVHLRSSFKLITTTEVYEEVYKRGIEKKVSEAKILRELFDGGVIHIATQKTDAQIGISSEVHSSGIHEGEASVISLALGLDAIAIIDDKRARQISRVLGVKVSGTPAIVIELVRSGAISKEEARRGIERMVREGWYCSARVFSEIIRAIDEAQFHG